MEYVIQLGPDMRVDIGRAFPLTLGDFLILEEIGVVQDGKITDNSVRKTFGLISHLLKKADSNVTDDHVRMLSIKELPIITKFIGEQFQIDQDKTETTKRPT